jgi:Cdc6-like AAA superfamily ATPase
MAGTTAVYFNLEQEKRKREEKRRREGKRSIEEEKTSEKKSIEEKRKSKESRVEIIKDLMSVPIEVYTDLPKAQFEEQAFTKIDIPRNPVLIEGYTGCGKSTFMTEFLQKKQQEGHFVRIFSCRYGKPQSLSNAFSSIFGLHPHVGTKIDHDNVGPQHVVTYLTILKELYPYKKMPIIVLDDAQKLSDMAYFDELFSLFLGLQEQGLAQMIYVTSEGSLESPLRNSKD